MSIGSVITVTNIHITNMTNNTTCNLEIKKDFETTLTEDRILENIRRFETVTSGDISKRCGIPIQNSVNYLWKLAAKGRLRAFRKNKIHKTFFRRIK